MFHIRTRQISATVLLFALSALPMQASAQAAANAPIVPAAQAQSSAIKASFSELKHETKSMLSETKFWVADIEKSVERVQDNVAPAGHSLKKSLKSKTPGLGLVQFADRTFSVFGLILMMSFSLVVFLMGLSNPMSRTGGRH